MFGRLRHAGGQALHAVNTLDALDAAHNGVELPRVADVQPHVDGCHLVLVGMAADIVDVDLVLADGHHDVQRWWCMGQC